MTSLRGRDSKGGFGFCPMLCATSGGETLSIRLGPGSAAANSICDHALCRVPPGVGQGPSAVMGRIETPSGRS